MTRHVDQPGYFIIMNYAGVMSEKATRYISGLLDVLTPNVRKSTLELDAYGVTLYGAKNERLLSVGINGWVVGNTFDRLGYSNLSPAASSHALRVRNDMFNGEKITFHCTPR